jgi:hypothetical protein
MVRQGVTVILACEEGSVALPVDVIPVAGSEVSVMRHPDGPATKLKILDSPPRYEYHRFGNGDACCVVYVPAVVVDQRAKGVTQCQETEAP